MASIEILKSGRVLHRIDDELAICMVESGLAKLWTPPVKPEPPPAWRIKTSEIDQHPLGLVITVGREEIIVTGTAEGMAERCEATARARKLPFPPLELLAHYAQLTGVLLDPDAVREAQIQRRLRDEQRFKEQAKLTIPDVARQPR